MDKIRVLIADDSVIYRSQIKTALSADSRIEVVGIASNGKIAFEKIGQTKADLLILDLEMPVMDGLQTLREIQKAQYNIKVLVFSSASKRGAEVTLEALKLGACDYVTKPDAQSSESEFNGMTPETIIRSLIIQKIHSLFPLKQEQNPAQVTITKSSFEKMSSSLWSIFKPKVIVIGSSTGGPSMLEKIFSNITPILKCPILIAQHMPPIFTAALAERLSKLSKIDVLEAKHGMPLENKVYIAPGDYHMRLKGTPQRCEIVLDQNEKIHSVRPAVDPLFQTASDIFKSYCFGLVLTGMGYDGRDGAIHIKKNGGCVAIQSESSCTVFGMPGAVLHAGAYDHIYEPEQIIEVLKDKALVSTSLAGTKTA